MSSTTLEKVDRLLEWLESNAFWNSELMEVRASKHGGVGVFWKLGPEQDPSDDKLLLRVPKSNVLSPKNSFLFTLLVDYEPSSPEYDFTTGMHAILLTYTYELAAGRASPWADYLDSFDPETAELPICLWSDDEKAKLANTEADLLNMLDSSELREFYKECCRFAEANNDLVPCPAVLGSDHLELFGRFVQSVISRAFTVDKFHGLSLVPGADLFNHMSPTLVDDIMRPQETVHFVCDDPEELCEECGEIGCPHMESEDEADDEEEEEEEEEDEEEAEEEADSEENGYADLMEDIEVAEDLSESDSEQEASGEDLDDSMTEEPDVDENKPITLSDIERLEESEDETELEDEELLTISDGETEMDGQQAPVSELAQELSDSSKCCDIVLTGVPLKEHDYELFNTYGNELANAYLLQRYGFFVPGNPNNTCLLSVPMFAWIKAEKKSKVKAARLLAKLEWYEALGFDLVNELCTEHSHEHEHEEEEDCGSSCSDDDCLDQCGQDIPETWQLSPRIKADGQPTPQTVALVRLLQMPFKVWSLKLQSHEGGRLARRTKRMLLDGDLTLLQQEMLRSWVQQRLDAYQPNSGSFADDEKAALRRAIAKLGN